MRYTNAFETLGLKVKPKALFEGDEWSSLSDDERILIFARMVWAGYHLKDEAYQYLTEKGASKKDVRCGEVASMFRALIRRLTLRIAERRQANKADMDIEGLSCFARTHCKWPTLRRLSLEQCADILEGLLRRSFSMREMLRSYLGERPPYRPLLDVPIDFDDLDALGEHVDAIDQRIALDSIFSFWTYRGVYASWCRTTWLMLKRGRSYSLPNHVAEHMNPRMWDTPPGIHSELALAKKCFPMEDTELLKVNDKVWREQLLSYATKQAEALWLQAPLFDEPVYVWYTNYTDKQALHTDRLHKEAIVSICVQDYAQTGNDEGHQEYFEMLVAGKSMARPKNGKYIQDFISLANRIKEQDVLVVASYKGHQDLRIGLIKKGTKFQVKQYEGYRLYYFKLKSAYCTPRWGPLHNGLNPADYPILKNLSPNRGTILHIVNQRRREAVYRAYYGIVYPYHYNLLSDEATEDMCRLWLTSEHAEAYDLYLSRPAPIYGGTTHIVDIWGISYGDIEILAQITTSSNTSLIEKKEKKLLTLSKHNTKCVVFANYLFNKEHENWGENRYRISLRHVWQDLYNGSEEEKEKMQALCQIEYKQTK